MLADRDDVDGWLMVPWSFPLSFLIGLLIEGAIAWHRARHDRRVRTAQRAVQRARIDFFRTGDGS